MKDLFQVIYFQFYVNFHLQLSDVNYDVCFNDPFADNVFEEKITNEYKPDVCRVSTKSFTKKGIDNKVFYEH